MGKSISDRMKTGLLAPRWEKVKGAHKELSGSLFTPDIMPVLKAYDGNFQKYVDLLDQKKKLKDMLDDYNTKATDFGTKIDKAHEELAKIQERDQKAIGESFPKLKKFTGDPKADLDEPNQALADLESAGGDLVTLRKALWDQITKYAEQKMALTKKVKADFKAKSDVITKGVEKLTNDADAQENQAKALITKYCAAAIKIKHDDWVEEIKSVTENL